MNGYYSLRICYEPNRFTHPQARFIFESFDDVIELMELAPEFDIQFTVFWEYKCQATNVTIRLDNSQRWLESLRASRQTLPSRS